MTVLDQRRAEPGPAREEAEAEALFKEARRRRHRRWLLGGITFVAAALVMTSTIEVATAPGRSSPPPRTQAHAKPARPTGLSTAVEPKQPGPLAIGPDGTLYIADDGRNQILARSPTGHFRVIAGTGKVGFSGDGGPAVDAKLDGPQGIAVSPNGTVYFADANRIRVIAPDGIITTIAGDGRQPGSLAPPPTATPAAQVAIGETAAVTLGPDGSVYLTASNEVLQLAPDGELAVVADAGTFGDFDPAYPYDDQCDPVSLAFDHSGGLYIGCSDPWVLLERAPDGAVHYVGMLRPHDAVDAMAVAPGGGVVALDGASVAEYGSAQRPTNDFLYYRLPGGTDFWPQGIAASADGSLYLSQDGQAGIGPPAIVKQSSSGSVSVLWIQRRR